MSHKILTVDDSKTIRMIVAKTFKAYDCVILEAENGLEGLAVAGREKPDLIILDYTMPVMDGSETLTRLRADPALKGTPVIMLTAEAGRDTVLKIAKLGVRDYLVKPFKDDLLIERVSRVINIALTAQAAKPAKRMDDPIHLLLCDDKPAIADQIRRGLADTSWKVTNVPDAAGAIAACAKGDVDVILASLSLPDNAAYTLFQSLRANPKCAALPVFGLSVRTATAEHAQAQQAGFAGVITKPIDPGDLKAKIAKALKLEISYKYFQQREGTLFVCLPNDIAPALLHHLSKGLQEELANAVDSGGDKVVIDLCQLEKTSVPILEFVVGAIREAGSLSLKSSVSAKSEFRAECASYEETQAWEWEPEALAA